MVGKTNVVEVILSPLSKPASASHILQGYQAYDQNGDPITGNIQSMNGSTITPNYNTQTVSCSGKKMNSNIVVNPIDTIKILMKDKVLYDGFDFMNYEITESDKSYKTYCIKWFNNSNWYLMNHAISTTPLNLSGFKYISLHLTNWAAATWRGGFWLALTTNGAAPQQSAMNDTIRSYHAVGGSASGEYNCWITLQIPEENRVNGQFYLKIEGIDYGYSLAYVDKVILHNKIMLGD